MAFTAIPSGDVWVQIGSTQTPTSGSAVTFSSIPAVKKLRLVVFNVAQTSSGKLSVTLNNDTATNYIYGTLSASTIQAVVSTDSSIQLGRVNAATNGICDFVIDYTNQASPKLGTGYSTNGTTAGNSNFPHNWTWNSTAIVNRVDVISANTFNATNTGTIALYGAF